MRIPSLAASSMNRWALPASRSAAVPQAITVSQPSPRITSAIRASASSPAWNASGPISPVRTRPRARRTMCFSRASTCWLPMASVSTTIRWMELEPTSMAAILMVPS